MREIEKRFIKSVVGTMDRRRVDVKNHTQIQHRLERAKDFGVSLQGHCQIVKIYDNVDISKQLVW